MLKEKKAPVSKFHEIKNPKYTPKDGECENIKTIDVMESRGIYANYCVDSKQIKTYLFSTSEWELKDAKEWVTEHSKELDSDRVVAKISIEDNGKMLAIASEETEDREGDVVSIDGWKLDNFKANPVLLWMHNRVSNHDGLPIGRAKSIEIIEHEGKRKLIFEPEFDDTTQFNRDVKAMAEKGLLNSFSVGFLGLRKEGNKFTSQELLEISLVPVPALATARVISRAKSLGISSSKAMQFVENVESRSVIKHVEHEVVTSDWDEQASLARVKEWAGGAELDKDKYGTAFTWFDLDNDKLSAYKLVHHDVVNGKLVTNQGGVVSAMNKLLGYKGGVDIPELDKYEVYKHLASHYEEMGLEAPEYAYVESQALKTQLEQVEKDTKLENYKDVKKHLQVIRSEMKRPKGNDIDSLAVEALNIIDRSIAIALEKATVLKADHLIKKEDKYNG